MMKKWYKDVIGDVVVTIVIIVAVILDNGILKFLIYIYSPLMLFVKILVLFGESFLKMMKRMSTRVPILFSHLLYLLDVIALLLRDWWILAATWAIIWILSWLIYRKTMRASASKPRRRKTKK